MKCHIRSLVESNNNDSSKDSWLRVLTYNTLAQSLIRRDVYPTNGSSVKWNVRFPALEEEIDAYKPNLMFLQEVDAAKMNSWKNLLNRNNLEHEYFKCEEKSHGLMIAWNKDIFTIDPSTIRALDYDKFTAVPAQTITGNVGMCFVLKRNETDEKYVVGTTHLYWHPKACFERSRQITILMSNASKLFAETENCRGMIIGADCNSSPNAAAYLLMAGGMEPTSEVIAQLHRSAEYPNFGRFGAVLNDGRPTMIHDKSAAVERLVAFANEVRDQCSDLGLHSCYKKSQGEEPKFTNWTEGFKDTIDYIFVSKSFNVKAVLEFPSPSNMGPEPSSLPRTGSNGHGYPSDHLPLMAELS